MQITKTSFQVVVEKYATEVSGLTVSDLHSLCLTLPFCHFMEIGKKSFLKLQISNASSGSGKIFPAGRNLGEINEDLAIENFAV